MAAMSRGKVGASRRRSSILPGAGTSATAVTWKGGRKGLVVRKFMMANSPSGARMDSVRSTSNISSETCEGGAKNGHCDVPLLSRLPPQHSIVALLLRLAPPAPTRLLVEVAVVEVHGARRFPGGGKGAPRASPNGQVLGQCQADLRVAQEVRAGLDGPVDLRLHHVALHERGSRYVSVVHARTATLP